MLAADPDPFLESDGAGLGILNGGHRDLFLMKASIGITSLQGSNHVNRRSILDLPKNFAQALPSLYGISFGVGVRSATIGTPPARHIRSPLESFEEVMAGVPLRCRFTPVGRSVGRRSQAFQTLIPLMSNRAKRTIWPKIWSGSLELTLGPACVRLAGSDARPVRRRWPRPVPAEPAPAGSASWFYA